MNLPCRLQHKLWKQIYYRVQRKRWNIFTGANATLDLCALGAKQEFCIEVVPNGKRESLDFKTDSAKDFCVKVEKLK